MTAVSSEPVVSKGSACRRIAPLLLILLAVLALCLLPIWPGLTLSDYRTGQRLHCLPIRRGETFCIRFTHSLNLSDVTDTFEWTGTTIFCRSTLFSTYGAGIPDLSDGIGSSFAVTEDGFLLSGIDKPEKEIRILLQTVPNHMLLYRGKSYSLLERFGSGALVVLKVERCSLPTLLRSPALPTID